MAFTLLSRQSMPPKKKSKLRVSERYERVVIENTDVINPIVCVDQLYCGRQKQATSTHLHATISSPKSKKMCPTTMCQQSRISLALTVLFKGPTRIPRLLIQLLSHLYNIVSIATLTWCTWVWMYYHYYNIVIKLLSSIDTDSPLWIGRCVCFASIVNVE